MRGTVVIPFTAKDEQEAANFRTYASRKVMEVNVSPTLTVEEVLLWPTWPEGFE